MNTVVAAFLVGLSIHLGAGETEKRAWDSECDTLAPLNCLPNLKERCTYGTVNTFQVVTKADGSKVKCPDCPRCVMGRKRFADCPQHSCPLVNDDICELGVKNNFYTTEDGVFCQDCDTCHTEDECPRLPCPLVNGDLCPFGIKSNFYVADGFRCRACDSCATVEECPPLPCPAVNQFVCPRGYKPNFYKNNNGANCRGCYSCASLEDCPELDCPTLDHCDHGVVQNNYQNGSTFCNGCDICYKD